MNVTFDKTSDVTGKIIVNVEPADYTETVKKELKKIAATHVIPASARVTCLWTSFAVASASR